MKRLLDLIISLLGVIVLSPLIIYIAIRVKLDSKGNIFYRQKRIGRNGTEFYMFKFRTMCANADQQDLLTYGSTDKRITKFGAWLRKYKLDEIPQLFNVLLGEMSIVGPRPEVPKYVSLYSSQQKEILRVRPGITDFASITFIKENDLLAKQPEPEQYYINHIMPEKLKLNEVFITQPTVGNYFRVIALTIKKIAAQ